MDYGEVFSKAGRLIWKHKILWLFGLLASCASGSSAGNLSYTFNAGNFSRFSGQEPAPFENFLFGLQQTIRQTPGWFFALALLLFCGVGILFWLIGVFGRTGLARGAWLADGSADRFSFSPLANDSLRSFWKVALSSLLVGLPGFAVGLVFVLILVFGIAAGFSQRAPGVGVVLICLGLPVLCLLVPFFWLLGVWGDLSIVAIVGEDLGVIDGLKRGWRMLTRRFGSVVLLAVLLFIAQIAFGILVSLLFAPIGIGVIMGGVFTRGGLNIGLGLILLVLLILVPISLFLGAVFHSYVGTVWALVFRRLAAAEAAPLMPMPPAAYTPPAPPVPPELTGS
jgi:hypothetical protein